MDGGRHTREIETQLDALDSFTVTRRFHNLHDADRAMARRQLDLVLVFPPDMSRDIVAGRPVRAQALVDAVTANSAAVAAAHLRQVLSQYNAELALSDGSGSTSESSWVSPPPELRSAILYNPGLVFEWYYLTGLISVIMFVDGSLVMPEHIEVGVERFPAALDILMSGGHTGKLLVKVSSD